MQRTSHLLQTLPPISSLPNPCRKSLFKHLKSRLVFIYTNLLRIELLAAREQMFRVKDVEFKFLRVT